MAPCVRRAGAWRCVVEGAPLFCSAPARPGRLRRPPSVIAVAATPMRPCPCSHNSSNVHAHGLIAHMLHARAATRALYFTVQHVGACIMHARGCGWRDGRGCSELVSQCQCSAGVGVGSVRHCQRAQLASIERARRKSTETADRRRRHAEPPWDRRAGRPATPRHRCTPHAHALPRTHRPARVQRTRAHGTHLGKCAHAHCTVYVCDVCVCTAYLRRRPSRMRHAMCRSGVGGQQQRSRSVR